MASEIRVTFEFEIGELVFIKGAQHARGVRPVQFCVTERLMQQCHGGIQRLYRLAGDGPNLHPEIALTREEPAYRPVSPAVIQEELAINKTRETYWRSELKKDHEEK